jgi:hypothetical protein
MSNKMLSYIKASKNKGLLNFTISLFFASLMIIASYILKDSGYSEEVVFILIAIWLVPFLWLNNEK